MATVYLWLLIASCVIFLSISYGSSFVANSASGLAAPGFILRDPMHLKLAFLNPTFTYAAYQNNSFYTFYSKYYPITGPSSNVISDLNLIKNKKIPHAPFYLYNQAAGGQPGIPGKHFIDRIVDTVALLAPKSNITFINDQDIEYGKLFYSNGKNAFDVIFLVHEEYITQTGYNSLKRFVSQGGTLVFTESNVLTVEVKYNHQNDSITLVKGHQFEFDGRVAKRSVEERWKNETSQWLGSNFLPQFKAAYFKDMPFNYTHAEEQYVSNPKAVILYDYKIFDPLDPGLNVTVASYEMNYGRGKILMTSLFAHKLDNDKEFFKFFKTIILPRAIGSDNKINLNGSSYDIYTIGYNQTGSLGILQPHHDIFIRISQSKDGTNMILDIPTQLFSMSEQVKPSDLHYSVTINNKTRYDVMRVQNEAGFEIPVNNDSRVIKIYANDQSPFTLSAPPQLTIQAQGPLTTVSDLGKPTIHGRLDPMPMIRNNAPPKFGLGVTIIKWTATDAAGYSATDMQIVNIIDKNLPTIRITYPKDRTSVLVSGGTIIIKGTSFDNEGVKKVDIQARSEFNNKVFPYRDVLPIKTGNWSSWTMPLDIREMTNPVLITARVTDISGHKSWDHVAFVSKGSK